MTLPIVDLHCDLLAYLAKDQRRTPFDQEPRCGIRQLKEGNVKLQTLAVFTETERQSVENGIRQIQIFQRLLQDYSRFFAPYSSEWSITSDSIAVFLSFENASGFCVDDEPLQQGFLRLKKIVHEIGKPLSISLTWNTENRFGGGAMTGIGLKKDGKLLLEELNGQRIAIDLSHASDALAYETIDYIEGHRLDIPIIATHSNARSIAPLPRNLPDEISKEIFRRGGVIGLNLFRHFIGETENHLIRHLMHWFELGGENHIALGADFFYDVDFPSAYRYGKEVFFKDFQDASGYGNLLSFLQQELKLDPIILAKFAHQNVLNFIKKLC